MKTNNTNTPPKLILLTSSPPLYTILLFFTFFTLASFTLTTLPSLTTTPQPPLTTLPSSITTALLHYTTLTNTSHLTPSSLSLLASTILTHSPCNLLIFGLPHETILYSTLNHHGKTVFIHDNTFLVTNFEHAHPCIEVYDVHYATKVRDATFLLHQARRTRKQECMPVQNLLYSECVLGVSDMPNFVYEVEWDVIVVDGPGGFKDEAPGRMAGIFTAGVLARSKGGKRGTHVFVHDYGREVERVYSEEFLCRENLVEVVDEMGHFVVGSVDRGSLEFCRNSTFGSS